MNMKKVLWISRHAMTKEQIEDLKRIYGAEIQINQIDKSISKISEIETQIKEADIICAVLPIELLQSLLNIADNRPVLVGKNERVATGKMTQMSDGKLEKEYVFKHGGWKQMISIKIETKDL